MRDVETGQDSSMDGRAPIRAQPTNLIEVSPDGGLKMFLPHIPSSCKTDTPDSETDTDLLYVE